MSTALTVVAIVGTPVWAWASYHAGRLSVYAVVGAWRWWVAVRAWRRQLHDRWRRRHDRPTSHPWV